MNLCYYQPVYNEDSDDVENEIIKLSIMHEQIDEENPVPPVIDSNDTSSVQNVNLMELLKKN